MPFNNKLTPKGFKSQVEVPPAPPPEPLKPPRKKRAKKPKPPPPTAKEEMILLTEKLKAEHGIEGVIEVAPKPAAPEAIHASLQSVLVTYANDPVGFVRDVLQEEPDDWQADLLLAVAQGTRRVSVRAGHGVGKSTACAWLLIWHMVTRFPQKAVVSAPTAGQLFDALFAEVKRWINKLPAPIRELFEMTSEKITLKAAPEASFISARTSSADRPEALAGVHCFAERTVDVLTRRGWVPIENISLVDSVLAKTVGSRKAHWEKPLEVINKPYIGPMYVHESRLLRFMVTPGHKFEYERRQCNKTVSKGITERWVHDVRAIEHMQKVKCRIPKTFEIDQPDIDTYVLPEYTTTRYGVPLKTRKSDGALATASREAIAFEVGDWAEFLGWYIAEGSLGRNKFGKASTVGIAQSRESNTAKYNHIVSLLESMGLRPTLGAKQIYISSVQIARHIEQIMPGKADTKRIPDFVFEFPSWALRRFLDAFRAGDGYGDFEYLTSSPGLADDIQRLILLSGGYATINKFERKGTPVTGFPEKPQTYRNGDYYRVREWKDWSRDHAFILPQKRSVVDYSGNVACLTMPSGMFYVRDRKSMQPFWTHNSEHVLLICDEASAIPEAVYESAAGSMSGEHACTVLIGNPTRNSGLFFKTHHQLASEWKTMHVSCLQSRRVSADFVKQIADTYGPESNAYRVRVLGEFALRDDDTLIPAELVDSAMARDITVARSEPVVYGLDVARFGDDRSVLCKRQGNVVLEFRVWQGLDLMQLTGAIVNEASVDKPAEICVDSIGLGSGVADRLRELGHVVRDVNVSEASAMNPKAAKLRDELWLAVKDWLNARACKLPKMDDLRQELVAPTYTFTSNGRIKVEGKAELKRRGMRSPDLADSLCISFASIASRVGGRSTKWQTGQPLRRGIKGVV